MQDRCFKIIAGILSIIAFSSFGFPAQAGVLDLTRVGIGARTLGLGRSQVVAEDLSSVFVNPANAAALDRFYITSMYSSLNEDVALTLVGAGFPVRDGVVGIMYLGEGMGGIETTARSGGQLIPVSTLDYWNRILVASYGWKINSSLLSGLSLKFFSKNISGVSGGAGNGVDLDWGMVFEPQPNLRIGFAAQNLLTQDMANLNWATGAREEIPANYKMGFSLNVRPELAVMGEADSLGGLHGGAEWKFRKNLTLRGGMESIPTSKSASTLNYSAGVGLEYQGFSFDYAYCLDTILGSNSAHFFSLGFCPNYKEIEMRPILPAGLELTRHSASCII